MDLLKVKPKIQAGGFLFSNSKFMLIYRVQIIMEQKNLAAEISNSSKGHFTPQTNTELASQKQGQMGYMGKRVMAIHATSNHCDLTLNSIGHGITSGVFRKVIDCSRMAEPLWIISCRGSEVLLGDRMGLDMYAAPVVTDDAVLVKVYTEVQSQQMNNETQRKTGHMEPN